MPPSQQRLAGRDLAVLEIEHRLIVGLEAAIRYRLTQFEFQDPPRLGAGIHAGLEEAIGPPPVALGAVQSEVRVPQQLVEIQPIAGGERDADAGIGRDQMTRTLERLPDRRINSINELSGFRLSLDSGLNDGELVTAEPRRHVGRLQACAQPFGDALEKLIADRMAEGVVDALELVDVDIEHRELFAGPERLQRLFQPFAKQHPVRQVGQRVVMRQMGDFLVGARALGDVLDRGHPAARLQRPVDDLDRPAARRFRELPRGLAERHGADDGVAERVDIAVKGSGLFAVLDQPMHRAAGLRDIRRQSEHLNIGLVADHDPRRCVIENKALRDIVHGDTELAPLGRQPLAGQAMAPQQQSDDAREDRDEDKQYAFAQAPGRGRHAGRNRHGDQDSPKGNAPRRPVLLGRIRQFARHVMAAIESHLVPPRVTSLRMTNGRLRYNLQLAIGYRDTRAGSIAPAPQITGPRCPEPASPLRW